MTIPVSNLKSVHARLCPQWKAFAVFHGGHVASIETTSHRSHLLPQADERLSSMFEDSRFSVTDFDTESTLAIALDEGLGHPYNATGATYARPPSTARARAITCAITLVVLEPSERRARRSPCRTFRGLLGPRCPVWIADGEQTGCRSTANYDQRRCDCECAMSAVSASADQLEIAEPAGRPVQVSGSELPGDLARTVASFSKVDSDEMR